MQLKFPEEIEAQYNLAFETIMSYRDSKSYSQLKNFAAEQRRQCLDGIEFLEISDVAIAIHDEILFENPPMNLWVENGATPSLDELRKFIKAKKNTANIIRKIYEKYSEKIFFAIVVAYLVEQNKNSKVVFSDDNFGEAENKNLYNGGNEIEEY